MLFNIFTAVCSSHRDGLDSGAQSPSEVVDRLDRSRVSEGDDEVSLGPSKVEVEVEAVDSPWIGKGRSRKPDTFNTPLLSFYIILFYSPDSLWIIDILTFIGILFIASDSTQYLFALWSFILPWYFLLMRSGNSSIFLILSLISNACMLLHHSYTLKELCSVMQNSDFIACAVYRNSAFVSGWDRM